MSNLEKYKGIIPAFYACYDENGNVSPEGVRNLTQYFIDKGVKGVYVNGSSGECIYQNVEERKIIIENVMAVAKGKLTVINHVACNNTRDSVELAKHSESVGVDAHTGMRSAQQLRTQILSFTTFLSWQGQLLP